MCNLGTYQFEIMPIRLKKFRCNFPKDDDNVLVNFTNVKRYIDNIGIYSTTEEIHIKHLENLFALVRKHGLRIRLKKCSFMQSPWNWCEIAFTKEVPMLMKEKCRMYVSLTHQVAENN